VTDLLVCSHRGPVSHRSTPAGVQQQKTGPGGLVPVILPALKRFGGTWLCAPSTDEDRAIASNNLPTSHDGIPLRFVALPADMHRDHYETVTNGCLARVFHCLFALSHAPTFNSTFRRAWESYRAVNDLYANAIRVHGRPDAILIEDMHLMLVAAALAREPGAHATPLLYFHHVPWCSADYFGVLPAQVREEILRGLLAHHSVAFHCRRWADSFGACCERFLDGAVYRDGSVSLEGRSVPVLSAPAALDAAAVRELVADAATGQWRDRFDAERAGRQMLVRVDRADLWKNVLRGFEAYAALLERRPDLRDRIWFLAILSPTRMWMPEYREYLADCERAAREINDRFSPDARAPDVVTVHLPQEATNGDRARALGAMILADAVLVNPLFDGLNMVAKEAVMAGETDAVLILSENAGAHEELGAHALSVNPFDVDDCVAALERAFDMSPDERAARGAALRRIVAARDPGDWLATRLAGWL
jgi:trehalose 6-phosphate synthase